MKINNSNRFKDELTHLTIILVFLNLKILYLPYGFFLFSASKATIFMQDGENNISLDLCKENVHHDTRIFLK